MSSFVYMKILETQPRRYDLGVAMLSLGLSERVRRRIVAENVRPGDRVLDLGCGTGSTVVLAARAGARVTGVDVSPGMLEVAREKVATSGLGDRVELVEMGVAGLESFARESFDLVVAMLVFSELSRDERSYALRHLFRILRRGGTLVVADEVRPATVGRRLLYSLIRAPLAALTFALTQTTTSSVDDLPELVRSAGFCICREERLAWDTFLYLVASKGEVG